MKIGIITIHNSPNYGACLQCYALWKFLETIGYEVEVINLYRPLAFKEYVSSKNYKRLRKPKRTIKYYVKKLIRSIKGNTSLYNKRAYASFESFNLRLKYSKAYYSIDELYKNPPLYDAYIAGSDQLWNPTQPYCVEPYFLTFVDGNKHLKLSYASSIGITDLKENEKQLISGWLRDFTAISVRENQAKDLLESFVDKTIHQVADPTFLLDVYEWEKLSLPPKEQHDYILLFTLSYNEKLFAFAKKIQRESQKRLIIISQNVSKQKYSSFDVIDNAGPQEWIGYVSQADMVVTDSFHCTVFSLIMDAGNVFAYISPKNNRGSRIVDLLNTFNLKNHLLSADLMYSYQDLCNITIDRKKLFLLMKEEQVRSRAFLTDSLNKAITPQKEI